MEASAHSRRPATSAKTSAAFSADTCDAAAWKCAFPASDEADVVSSTFLTQDSGPTTAYPSGSAYARLSPRGDSITVIVVPWYVTSFGAGAPASARRFR